MPNNKALDELRQKCQRLAEEHVEDFINGFDVEKANETLRSISMNTELRQKFLVDTDDTGRFIVSSKRTGKQYWVEPVGNPYTVWGSVQSYGTGEVTNKKGWKRHRGSIDEVDSLITKENGFEKIHDLTPGQSPLSYIDHLDSQYPEKEND